MKHTRKYSEWILLAFAATAVASVALQNLIWPALALWLYGEWKTGRKIKWKAGFLGLATGIFLLTFVLGALFGVNPGASFKNLHKYLAMLIFLPVAAMALSPGKIRRILFWILAGASFCAAWAIPQYYLHITDRIASFSGHWMVFSGLLCLCVLVGFYLIRHETRNPWHWALTLFCAWGLLLTQTRGAWLACLAGAFLLAWRLNRRLIPLGLAVLLAGYFVLPENLQFRVRSVFELQARYNTSNSDRICMAKSGWRMIQDHPMGVGQNNVEALYPQYRLPEAQEPSVPHMHNNFLQLLVQNGWLGLLAYLFWLGVYFWKALAGAPGDREGGDLNWLFTCLMAAAVVWGLTEYTFSHQFMTVQFFLLGLQAGTWEVGKKRSFSPRSTWSKG